jgi:PPOX class probable F420-dependent enzyme
MTDPNDTITMDDEVSRFARHEFLNLETYKRDGRGVRTPVWFTRNGDALFIRTMEDSGKVKRIRNNPSVRIAPCDARGALLGAWVEATARLATPDEARRIDEPLSRKYGEITRGFDLISSLRGTSWAVIRLDLSCKNSPKESRPHERF